MRAFLKEDEEGGQNCSKDDWKLRTEYQHLKECWRYFVATPFSYLPSPKAENLCYHFMNLSHPGQSQSCQLLCMIP